MVIMTTIFVTAAILVLALCRKRDVRFNMKFMGANVMLEARDTVDTEEQKIERR